MDTNNLSQTLNYTSNQWEKVMYTMHVGNLQLASNNIQELEREKKLLQHRFSMKDLVEAIYCLGIQIHRDRENKLLLLYQTKYLTNMLQKFGMEIVKLLPLHKKKTQG